MGLTLRELGAEGLRREIDEQDRREMAPEFAGSHTDLSRVLPGPLGRSGALTRKRDAGERILIDQEKHGKMIIAEICRLYTTEHGRQTVSKHARRTRNVLRRVADLVSVAYERPPVRTMDGKRGTRKMATAWREVVLEEGGFDLRAELWSRYAFLTNVVHVIPQVLEGELRYIEVLPHASDVIFGPGDNDPSILSYVVDGGDHVRVAVDAERFWYLDENYKIVDQFVHGYRDLRGRPMQPWTAWRCRPRLSSMDYWQRGVGRQLVDATMHQSVVQAAMTAVRQTNNAKLSSLSAPRPKEDIPPAQQVSPEHPMILRGGSTFEVHDLIVPVKEFLEQLDAEEEAIAEAYGVPRGALDKSTDADPWMTHQAVAKVREQQIKYLRRADRETSIKTAIIMRADRHPRARDLPPERVASALTLTYAEHTFLERPQDRYEAWRQELSLGLADHADLRMRLHPDEDKKTAMERVKSTVSTRGEISAMMAAHNTPADAGQDLDTVAQLQGRLGGRASPPDPDGPDERREQRQQQ